jgi:hypothetical protein
MKLNLATIFNLIFWNKKQGKSKVLDKVAFTDGFLIICFEHAKRNFPTNLKQHFRNGFL